MVYVYGTSGGPPILSHNKCIDEHGGLSDVCTCPSSEATVETCECRGKDPTTDACTLGDEHIDGGSISNDTAHALCCSEKVGADTTYALGGIITKCGLVTFVVGM